MSSTVIGLFDNRSDAEQVVQQLVNGGFARDQISLVQQDERGQARKESASDEGGAGEGAAIGAGTGALVGGLGGLLVGIAALPIPGIGPIIAAGPIATALAGAGAGAVAGGLIGALAGMGVPEEEARYYEEGVRRGGTLVMVVADTDERGDAAAEIMRRYGAVNIDERSREYEQGWATSASTGTAATTQPARASDQPESMEVVEEQLKVGKREVERGGVRIYRRTTEQAVAEDVQLREERVRVDRRPVDRPATAADRGAFEEEVIEVTERAEEPVVEKEARVVEEVDVSKDVDERTETVRDTVRKSDVEVERIPGRDDAGREGKSADEAKTKRTRTPKQ